MLISWFKKKHGLSKAPDSLQVSSYVLVIATNGFIFGGVLPLIPYWLLQLVIGLMYLAIEIIFVVAACKLTLRDPTEVHTIKTAYYRSLGLKVKFSGSFNHYCKICESVVEPNVHHCKQCMRCVKGLDHHCKWINNCVDADVVK